MDAQPPSDVIVITAPRMPEAPGEAVYDGAVVDQITIDNSVRLDQALTLTPGVDLFRRNDSAAANPTIQGLSLRAIGPSGAGRALVTLDGVPQLDPFGGWVIWAGLPPELTAGANIIRGAGAGPYGAGALTGNVALQERQKPGFVLSAEGGQLGTSRYAGVGEAQGGGVDFLLAGVREQSDGWIPVRQGRGAADEPLAHDSLAGEARLELQKGPVLMAARLSGYQEDRGTGLVGGDGWDNGASASLTLVRQPEAAQLGWRVQAWTRQSDMSNSFVSTAPGRTSTTPSSLQAHTPATGWGVNAALRWNDGEAGFDVRAADGETQELFRYVTNAFTRTRNAGGDTLSAGLYLEQWRQLGDLLLSGGVRLDYWNATDGHRIERNIANGAPTLDLLFADSHAWAPTARFGVKRSFGDLYLRTALYTGFRPPTLNELYRPFRVGNDVTEANAVLKPERLYGVDAAIGADHSGWRWSLGAFANRLVDPITNVTEGMGPGTFPPGDVVPAGGAFRVRENAGAINGYGVDGDAQGALTSSLDWRVGFEITHARVDGGDTAPQLTGRLPAQAPRWSASAGLAWRPWIGGELDADAHAESARFDDDQNAHRLAAATDVDLRLGQQITDRAQVYLTIDNAFDAGIQTAIAADGTVSYAPPRVVRIGFRITG
ncbi:MAG: TonB-dependent receptor [Alphaproteobacteria bacterium]